MPKYYVKWQSNPMAMPSDPQEQVKLWLSQLEMTKADMKAGKLKDWGICVDGSGGYGIMEASSEAEFFTAMLKWMPHIVFDAKTVLTVDQTIESIKKVAAAGKAK